MAHGGCIKYVNVSIRGEIACLIMLASKIYWIISREVLASVYISGRIDHLFCPRK